MRMHQGPKALPGRASAVFLIALVIITVATLYIFLLRSPTRVYEATDFLGYWAAANLLAHQENPYDHEALLALEREQGWQGDEPVYSWNPPWLHLILLPLGALSFRQAAALWFVVNPLLIGVSALLMWDVVSQRRGLAQIGLALLAAFLFSRSLHALLEGQINTLVLVGCASFLTLALARRDLLAGAALVLVTVKPHLAYLLLPTVLLIGLLQRRWRIIIGFSACLTFLVLLASWLFPHWGEAYLSLFDVPASPLGATAYITPTVRGFLKALANFDIGAWPAVICLTSFLILIPLRGRDLSLATVASLSLLFGLPTAPFGWSTDQILLLLPILQIAAWIPKLTARDRRIAKLSLVFIYAYALCVWLISYRDVTFLALPAMVGLLWAYTYRKVLGTGGATGKPVIEPESASPH